MKGNRSMEMDWSSVDGMGSSGQVVGILDSSGCRRLSVEREEKHVNFHELKCSGVKEEREG